MSKLYPSVDPEGLIEYSVVYTDRSLNHMSQAFQGVMKNISGTLKQVYNAQGVAVVPGVLASVVNLPNVSYRTLAGAPIVSEVAAVYRRFERAPAVRNMIAALRASKPVQVHAATMA